MPCTRLRGNEKVRSNLLSTISSVDLSNTYYLLATIHPSLPRRRHTGTYLSVEEIKIPGKGAVKPAPRHAHAAVYHPALDVSPTCLYNTSCLLTLY